MGLLSGFALHRALGEEIPELTIEERLQTEFPLQWALLIKDYEGALSAMPMVADIDEISPITGSTALCLAAKDESADAFDMVIALVLKHLADVRQADYFGNTPLHYAAGAGNLAVVKFLIDNGSSVHSENQALATPYFTALEGKRNRVAEYLLQKGARRLTAQETQQLKSAIVLKEAIGRVQSNMKPAQGEPTIDGFRESVVASFDTAIESLQAEGNIEALKLVEGYRSSLLKAIDETPRTENMSMKEWGKELALRSSSYDPSELEVKQ